MSNIIGTSMDYTDIRYGILLSSGQLDFLRDDCQGFHRSEAMATFVKMAAIEPMYYEKKNFSAEIGIGQFVASTVELAKLWGYDRKTAARLSDCSMRWGYSHLRPTTARPFTPSTASLSGW
jgi:hypothetical protein